MIDEILRYNKEFVKEKAYEAYRTDRFPQKKIAIVACMDTRLTLLLPAALGLKNGDVKMIKNAGGVVRDPFGGEVRSLLVAIYELGVDTIMVIGHTNCGVQYMNGDEIQEKMRTQGIKQADLDLLSYSGIDFHTWFRGYDTEENSVRESLSLLNQHPLIPDHICIRGFVMDSITGELTEVKS